MPRIVKFRITECRECWYRRWVSDLPGNVEMHLACTALSPVRPFPVIEDHEQFGAFPEFCPLKEGE